MAKEESRSVQIFEHVFTAIGLLLCLSLLLNLLSFIWLYFLRPSGLHRYLRPNAWALVTGASDGIGRALSRELARRGFNVVLHGRNAEKLDVVKRELEGRYPQRRFTTVIADAAAGPDGKGKGMHEAVNSVAAQLTAEKLGGPLTVLINNCGGTRLLREEFTELRKMRPDEIDGIINLNATFHVHLTRALLPLLEKEEKDDTSNSNSNSANDDDNDDLLKPTITKTPKSTPPALIMYTGSVTGILPSPWLTTYSAAKLFGNAFMLSLSREMRETNPNVECMSFIVGKTTDTSFHKFEPGLFLPTSDRMARSALDRVGCGRASVVAHWSHAVQLYLPAIMPEFLQTMLINMAVKDELKVFGLI